MADGNVWRMDNFVRFNDSDGSEGLRADCYRTWGMREIAESSAYIPKTMEAEDLKGLSECVATGQNSIPFKLHQQDVRESMVKYAVLSLLTDQAKQGVADVSMDFLKLKSGVPDVTKVATDYLTRKNIAFDVKEDIVTAHLRK